MTTLKTRLSVYFLFTGMIVSFLFLIGCQQPIDIEDPVDTEKTFDKESTLFELLYKVTLLDGSGDNLLDDGSCIQVVLPVTILFESEAFTVNTANDFESLALKMSSFGVNPEDLDYQFPIRVRDMHHNELTVNNEDELEDLASDCETDGSDPDIECVDLIYPLELNIYNKLTEQSSTFTANDDPSMHGFLEGLSTDDLVSIEYPVSLVTSDSNDLTATTNSELSNFIDANASTCDENDDTEFDFEVDLEFIQMLTSTDWFIHHFYDDLQLYADLRAYSLSFHENGTIAIDNSTNTSNTWTVKNYGDELELEISFSNEPLSTVNLNWSVTEYSGEKLILKKSAEEDDSENHYLILADSPKTTFNDFESVITSKNWFISSLTETGESESDTEDYAEITFRFGENGQILVEMVEESIDGVWFSIFETTLVIDLEDSELDELNREWAIVEYSSTAIKLEFEHDLEEKTTLVFSPRQ